MAFPNLRLQNIFDQFGGGYEDPFQPYQPSPTYPDNGPMMDPYQQSQQGPSFDPSLFRQGLPGMNDGRSPTNDFQSWMEAMNKGYTPDTTSTDRLNQLLNSTPNMQDYNPSFGRKLTASMAGWKGGPEVADKIMNAPYLHDMAEWQAKTGPYAAAAAGENQRNIQERTLVSNAATSFAANQRNAELQRKNEEDIRIRDKKLEQDKGIADQKAQIARDKQLLEREKMSNANVQFTTDTPTLLMFDKATKKWTDTGIPTKDMSTMEKMWWQGAIAAGVANARPQAPQSELEQGRGSQRMMEGILQTDPDGLGKWIEVGDDGRYKLKRKPVPSAGGMFGIGAVPQSDLDEWMTVAKKAFPDQFGTTAPTPAPPMGSRGGVPQAEGQAPSQFTPIPRGQGAMPPNISTPQNQIPQSSDQNQVPLAGGQPQKLTPEQQQQQTTGLANGTMIKIQDARSGEIRVIPNTYQDIQESMSKGWNVVKKGK